MIVMWTDYLSVNVQSFDEDHKHLLRVLNELHRATQQLDAQGCMDVDEIDFAIHRFENHALFHCAQEEKAMEKTGYPALEKHREEHETLKRMAADLGKRFRGSASPRHAQELMQVIYEWIVNHVNVTDKEYTEHLNANGIF